MFKFHLQVPEIEDYWKTSWNSSIPFFGNLMPRDRFLEIFWLLHISHPDPSHPEKKIDKIRALLELLAKFQNYFFPVPKTRWWDFTVDLAPLSTHQRNQ